MEIQSNANSTMTAMVVEDDKVARLIISHILQQHNFSVYLTDDYHETIDHYVNAKPSLVILDYHLEKFNGLDLAYALRNLQNNHHPRLVLYTNENIDKLCTLTNFVYLDHHIKKNDIYMLNSIINLHTYEYESTTRNSVATVTSHT